MSRVAFLDDSFPFTGASLREGPLGGIQTATVMLAETLAARGHQVEVWGKTPSDDKQNGVLYRPLSGPRDGREQDLLVANCAAKLFAFAKGKKRALWLHGPARYLRKPRHFLPYFKYGPTPVFLGDYHASTWPRWIPAFRRFVIPHAVGAPFTCVEPLEKAPPPRAIFLSNPRRNMDWVLDVWEKYIHPAMPEAELRIFAGKSNYGSRRDDKLDQALSRAKAYESKRVVLCDPVAKDRLCEFLRESRVMLYRGDPGETFCFAAAEAQAAGVPLVTAGLGALKERVIDGRTGFLREDPEAFARGALDLLRDDALWHSHHREAMARRATCSWTKVAETWEERFGLDAP